jgi:pyruvate/2-oxoglutarate/acetoin dehydrogenase E1 component
MHKNSTNYAEIIDETFYKIFKKHHNSIVIGLGANDPKGYFGTTNKIKKHFKKRVFDMPISENSMTGVVIGASLKGLKPILMHQRVDFSLLSLEQIINQAAKWYYMFDGKKSVPIVIRMIIGRGWGQGPQHSQAMHSIFSHIPGLKVVMPSLPETAGQLLYSSFLDKNPVIFLEHRWLFGVKTNAKTVLKNKKILTVNNLNSGNDISIITTSYMTLELRKMYDLLKKNNIEFDHLDINCFTNLDKKKIIDSVKKTKKALILDVGHKSFGVSAEISAMINDEINEKTVIKRLALPDIPSPTSYALTKYFYPATKDICNVIGKITNKKLKLGKEFKHFNEYMDQPDPSFMGPF